jgi:hypothetical protein
MWSNVHERYNMHNSFFYLLTYCCANHGPRSFYIYTVVLAKNDFRVTLESVELDTYCHW